MNKAQHNPNHRNSASKLRPFVFNIRSQLLLAMFLTAMVAVIVSVATETVRHTNALRHWANQEASSVADAMAQDFLKLIVLGDPDGAANLVGRLASFPLIKKVEVFSVDGKALFQYERAKAVQAEDNSSDAEAGFSVTRDVTEMGTRYGAVELTVSGEKLRTNISDYYQFLAALLLGLAVVTVLAASFFQRFFTGPVLQLTGFMQQVAHERNFELRIPSNRKDEFGVLYGGLNALLAEMQAAQRNIVDQNAELSETLQELRQREQDLVAEHAAKEGALREKLEAEFANQAKSTFLANMSHEIRTPLTAIIGFSEALLDVNQTMSERVEAVQTINRTGKHLLNVINDILDLSKIEAGRLEVEKVPVPLLELVAEVAALGRSQAEAKDLVFSVEHVFPLPAVVQGDPVRIRQILLNLCSNAIKFTEKGGVTLRVSFDEPVMRLRFDVIDTGIGISPAQMARLFQPFSQADSATTRRFGGTGLGLVLSRQLAEKMAGSIDLTSEPGQGSCFTFALNVGAVEGLVTNAEEVQRAVSPALTADRPMRLRGTVLLAEDNLDNQRLIALNVRQLGADLTVVGDGQLAVAEALMRAFDIILMDMQMPVMDGVAALQALRQRGYRGAIVALTANATHQDMQNCLAAGFDDFLTKPIDKKRFNQVLSHYLVELDTAGKDGAEESGVVAILANDPAKIDSMRQFHERLCDVVARLELSGKDLGEIRSVARELKSLAGSYGSAPIVDLAGQIEFAATRGDARFAKEVSARLSAVVRQIPAEIAAHLAGRAPTDGSGPIISALLDDGPDMADLVAYFMGRLPGYVTELGTALARADFVAIKRQAHDLKSVGGGYGYPQVTELALKIEASAMDGQLEPLAGYVTEFEALAARIEAGAVVSGIHTPIA